MCGQRALFPLITQSLTMSLGFIAFVMSATAASGCAYIALSGDANRCYPQFGLFNWNNVAQCTTAGALYSGCTKYTSMMTQDTSGSVKPAQAMAAIAATFGGILWAGCMFMLFFRFKPWIFKSVGGLYIFCFVAQILTLLMLNDDTCNGDDADAQKLVDPAFQCNLGSDAVLSIIAAIFYLGIGITVLVCPVPKTQVLTCLGNCCKDICGEGEEAGCGCCTEDATTGAVVETTNADGITQANRSTVTETYNDDGTIAVREEKTNPDGSTTVSVTTKPSSDPVSASV